MLGGDTEMSNFVKLKQDIKTAQDAHKILHRRLRRRLKNHESI